MSIPPDRLEEPAGTIDFSKIRVIGLSSSGIQSINGDTTAAQLLTGRDVGAGPTIIIIDDGVGGHTFETRVPFINAFTPGGSPAHIPNNTPTIVLSLVIPCAGLWYFTGNINQQPPSLPISAQTTCRIYNNGSAIGESGHNVGGSANQGDGHSVTSYLINAVGGETIDLEITQENSGLGILDYNAVLDGIRLGS